MDGNSCGSPSDVIDPMVVPVASTVSLPSLVRVTLAWPMIAWTMS